MKMNQGLICFFKKTWYVINLDQYADVGTYWIALFYNRNEIAYFESFGVEYVPEEIKEFVGNKNIKAKIFRIQKTIQWCVGIFALDSLILC